jgi:PAS domain S-box-containing protein
MKKKEDRYRAVFECSSDALLVMDRGEILDCNPRTLELFGCLRREIIGNQLYNFSPEEQSSGLPSRLTITQHFDRAFSGEDLAFDWIFSQPDGSLFEAQVNLNSIILDGQETLLASVRTIETQNKIRQEAIEKEIKVQQIQKMESLGLMAGGIAHDFNNFLLAIMGNADLLDQDLNTDMDGQALLDEIRLAASRAADMCNQLLAYAGKGHCHVRSVDLSSITREMVRMLQIGIPRKITLRLDLDQNMPCIEADASQLQQVIMNLVVNASESIGRAEGTISLSTGEHLCDVAEFDHCLCSETFGGPRHLYIEVVDSGTGMDKETMQRICDPFYSSKLHSRGLGLASVLGIVRAHHGALCIKSSPGEGTCVRACLPLVESQSEPMVVPPAAEVETSAQGLILVVDDEEFLRVLCGRMLRRLGYEVVMAASGQEALDVYSERSGEIVCVILDLIMPGMDGVEVHEKLTAMDPEALVVMTSGYHLAEIAARFEGRGMAGFIQKPYRFTNLAEIVGSVIQSHKASG